MMLVSRRKVCTQYPERSRSDDSSPTSCSRHNTTNSKENDVKTQRTLLGIPIVLALAATTACASGGTTDVVAENETEAGSCAAEVTEYVDEVRQELPLLLPEPSFSLADVAGSNIWVINVVTNQYINDSNEGQEAAASAAGVDLTIFDGQGNVNTWNEGIQQAIAQGADGIVLYGIHSALVSEGVKEATEAGITVVEAMGVNYDADLPEGVFTNTSGDYNEHGKAAAAWTLADSDCSAKSYLLFSSGLPIWVNTRDGVLDAYDTFCPECEIAVDEVELANIATELPRYTQTHLSQSPDTEYILATWDSAIPFIESGAAQVNSDVKLVARDGIDEALDDIRSGGMQKATVASAPPQWIAWVTFDNVLRGIVGEEPNDIVIPIRLIDETNIGESNADVMSAYVGFEDEFAAVWSGQ